MCQAEERKAALRKIPEQVILSEVRHMVEEMQSLNKKLEETVSLLSSLYLCMCLSMCIFGTCVRLMLLLVVHSGIENCEKT